MTRNGALRSIVCSVAICGSAALGGCGDDPFRLRWSSNPETALIYSLARPELNLATGFDFTLRRPVQIQAAGSTGTWDFVVDTQDEQLVLLPPGFFSIETTARIAVLENRQFEEVLQAPEDTLLYVADEPVPVRLGNVYVIQTHRGRDQFGQLCRFYAKMEPIEADVQLGTLRFLYDTNPLCEDLDLVPPEERG